MIAHKTYKWIQENRLLNKGESILVGVSGGADSIALCLILKEISERFNQKWRIALAHLNHGIRGCEALRDEKFVKVFARRHKFTLYTKRISIPSMTKGKSFEALARRERYNFLESIACKKRVTKVAVAHNLGDQAETLLMRILEGTGLRGLRGILSARPIHTGSKITLIRPLLPLERNEIITYLKAKKELYCVDSTNLSRQITRNKIRLELLPLLKKYNTDIAGHLASLGHSAQEAYDYLEAAAQKEIANFKGNSVSIARLKTLHPALREMVLINLAEKHGTAPLRLSHSHYSALAELIDNPSSGKEVTLPGNLIIRRRYDYLYFIKNLVREKPLEITQPLPLKIPGETASKAYGLRIKTAFLKSIKNPKKRHPLVLSKSEGMEEVFDYGMLKRPLHLRFRLPSDKFRPLGMEGSISLKKFFINDKVTREMRQRIPLITCGNEIIWVIGYRMGESVKITSRTGKILKITCRRMP
jgi:tRNA(Ile)-lysidine synthase